jgi:hypothetical protein
VRLRTLTEEAPSPERQVDGIVAAIYARPFLRGLGRYCTEQAQGPLRRMGFA